MWTERFKNVQNIRPCHKHHHKSHEKLKSAISNRRKKWKIQKHLLVRFTLAIVIYNLNESPQLYIGLVGGSSRSHRLDLCTEVRPLNECPVHETKQSDNQAPVILELLGIRNIPSLLFLPGPLRPGVVTPDEVQSMGQIERFEIYT